MNNPTEKEKKEKEEKEEKKSSLSVIHNDPIIISSVNNNNIDTNNMTIDNSTLNQLLSKNTILVDNNENSSSDNNNPNDINTNGIKKPFNNNDSLFISNKSLTLVKTSILTACLITLLTIGFIYLYSFYIHIVTHGPLIKIVHFSVDKLAPKTMAFPFPLSEKNNTNNQKNNININNNNNNNNNQNASLFKNTFTLNMEIMTRPHEQDDKNAIVELEYLFLDIIQNDTNYIKVENICRNSLLTKETIWSVNNVTFNVNPTNTNDIKIVARLKYRWHKKWWWIYILQPYKQDVKKLFPL